MPAAPFERNSIACKNSSRKNTDLKQDINATSKETATLKSTVELKSIVHKTLPSEKVSNETARSRFLVIGCGSEQQGDEAAGLQVAKEVENWQLSSVKTLTAAQLSPDHATEIANADYVIFVDACSGQSCSRTVQVEPVVGDFQPLRQLSGKPQGLNPWTLLNLTEQRYGESPQAWLLKVPAERVDTGSALSTTAQLGCDRATTTIARFLKNY
ncbi:MAG: hydrogenase maturation protease [Cyanobacteria bacterium P01_F01_bin.3]